MEKQNIAGVTKVVQAHTVRTRLGQILNNVNDKHDRFLISRRGKAQAVIISVEDYLRNIMKRPEALSDLQKEAKKKGLDKLTMDEIDAEIASHRRGI